MEHEWNIVRPCLRVKSISACRDGTNTTGIDQKSPPSFPKQRLEFQSSPDIE